MNRDNIIAAILAILVLIVFTIYVINQVETIEEDLQICKELGYDGIKFVNAISTQVECSNFTDLEREREKRSRR